MFRGGMGARQVVKFGFLRTPRERAGMMNQQLLYQVSRQAQERGFLICSVWTSGAKGLDFDQFEIELVHYCGWLQCVIRALAPHARAGNASELGVEKINQLAGGLMIAVAEARHQPRYRIGSKRG